MCSIAEEDFGDEGGEHAMIPNIELTVDSDLSEDSAAQICNKCKKSVAIYKLPFRQAECRECFLLYTRHKFRAPLGSSKILPKDAKVILVFDGSANSVVLLDMLHHTQSQSTFKRLHCIAKVIYIDDFQLLEQCNASDAVYKNFIEEIVLFLQKYSYFDSFIVPMVNVKDIIPCITNVKNITEQQYHLQHKSEKQSLLDSVKSIKSLTSRQDYVKYHRSKLIGAIAKYFSSEFAFVSDISSDLAHDLLAAVALGRGGSAALDVSLTDDRLFNDVKLIRPLRDLNGTEINLYLKAQNLRVLQTKYFGIDAGSTASLQNLTKSFVDNLQLNFPATVSTVFRTGNKIDVNRDAIKLFQKLDLDNSDNFETHKVCLFCNSILDYHDSSTLLEIEFSRLVSEDTHNLNKLLSISATAKENLQYSTEKTCWKHLCHACRNICMDTSNDNIFLK